MLLCETSGIALAHGVGERVLERVEGQQRDDHRDQTQHRSELHQLDGLGDAARLPIGHAAAPVAEGGGGGGPPSDEPSPGYLGYSGLEPWSDMNSPDLSSR